MATDQIHIRDLRLRTIIGINEEERRNKQDVVINITLYADHSAAVSDNIDDTVNYRTIAKQTIELVENSQFFLVEKMALEIVRLCLADPRAERAVVVVEKPGAVRFARSVGVTVDRSRGNLESVERG
jgi:D-erythro-7,8-dihydroneopterin triphosphate epimerase